MNMYNILLLCILVGVIMVDVIVWHDFRQNIRRAEIKARRALAECSQMRAELQAAQQRDVAVRSLWDLNRDQKIVDLEAKNKDLVGYYEEKLRAQEAKHKMIGEIAQQLWNKEKAASELEPSETAKGIYAE